MRSQVVLIALFAHIRVVAIGHVKVLREPVDPARVLVASVHQGEAAVARRADQAVGVTLEHSSHLLQPRRLCRVVPHRARAPISNSKRRWRRRRSRAYQLPISRHARQVGGS